jgi:hypothetical protein
MAYFWLNKNEGSLLWKKKKENYLTIMSVIKVKRGMYYE